MVAWLANAPLGRITLVVGLRVFCPYGALSPIGIVRMQRYFGYPASCRHDTLLDDVFWNVCPTSVHRGLAVCLVQCACVLHVPSGRALPLDWSIVLLCPIFFVSCGVGVGLWHDLLLLRPLCQMSCFSIVFGLYGLPEWSRVTSIVPRRSPQFLWFWSCTVGVRSAFH